MISAICSIVLISAVVVGGRFDREVRLMHQDYIQDVIQRKYMLEWLRNTEGELSEETDYFDTKEDLFRFIRDMLEIDYLFEIVKVVKL